MSSSSSIIISLFLLLTMPCFAQSPTLSGRVLDNGGQPIPYANVVLQKIMQDSTFVKNTLTDEAGQFQLAAAADSYQMRVSALGYDDYSSPVNVAGGSNQLPDITLIETTQELNEVVINSRRPVVTRKIDRLEFNVENSTLSSENAWEILRKTPGVSAVGDQLAIRGSSGILVTINDKKVYLTGTELKNLLENTDGDNVKSVEVITTPPARYEAQGSAVLNIKLKRGGAQGYKGSVSGAYVQGVYPKGVVSTNHFYTSKKISATAGVMFGSGNYYGANNTDVTYTTPAGIIASVWRSREEAVFKAESQRTYNLDLQYQPDTLNTYSIGGTAFNSLQSTADMRMPTYIYGNNGALDSLFVTQNRRSYPQKNTSFNAFYEHRFNQKDKLSVSGDYANNYFNESQDINSDFSLPGMAPYRSTNILTDDVRNIYVMSLQADYTATKWGSPIEAGLRYGKVDADNAYNFTSEGGVPNPTMSNTFLYNEEVLAAYGGVEREFGKYTFKAGLRAENTSLQGNSITTGEVNKQDYLKVFPSFYALYKPNDNHQVGLSYGKRIIRPQYGELNPFRSYVTPYAYMAGNPTLRPAIAHNFSLLYTYANKYNADLFYRYEEDPSMVIVSQDYTTNTLISQVSNVKSNRSLGLDLNADFELYPWWTNGLQGTAAYRENTFQGADGVFYTGSIVNVSAGSHSRFTFTKDKSLTGEVYFDYYSPTISGASEYSAMSSLMFSVRKKLFKGNGEVTMMFLDIYKGQVQEIRTQYANQNTISNVYNETRNFRLQFRYRFGNQKLKGERNREQTDEQRRL